jgi:hypothetical protein
MTSFLTRAARLARVLRPRPGYTPRMPEPTLYRFSTTSGPPATSIAAAARHGRWFFADAAHAPRAKPSGPAITHVALRQGGRPVILVATRRTDALSLNR